MLGDSSQFCAVIVTWLPFNIAEIFSGSCNLVLGNSIADYSQGSCYSKGDGTTFTEMWKTGQCILDTLHLFCCASFRETFFYLN